MGKASPYTPANMLAASGDCTPDLREPTCPGRERRPLQGSRHAREVKPKRDANTGSSRDRGGGELRTG